MVSIELLLAGAILVSLTFYVLMGGADYGAGVWHFLAQGSHAKAQRELIAKAIGPIWEANHVWLILAITILFNAFPRAYALITTTLHIPLTLMIIGVVLRGSAFAFKSYDVEYAPIHHYWEGIFAWASIWTPVLLGITIGGISSGTLQLTGNDFSEVFLNPWLAPFPFAVGLFTLMLFAMLAAVYLTLETKNPVIQEKFRQKSLWSVLLVGALGIVVLWLSQSGAPEIQQGLETHAWGWTALIFAVVLGSLTFNFLRIRRFRLARYTAAGQVTVILWGWALAQYPFLVPPELTIYNTAAPPLVMQFLLFALLLGALLLFPSLYVLYRIFKKRQIFDPHETPE